MAKRHHPRRGTLQFWPRVRSTRQYPKIRSWPSIKDTKLLGFIGYKAGMTHIIFTDTKGTSPTKGLQVSTPVTVLECPPIKPLSIRFYKKTLTGLKLLSEIFAPKLDKELKRKLQKTKSGEEPKEFDVIRLVVYTQPRLTGIGKKKPEILEIGIGGQDLKQKLAYAKSILDKEIILTDVFKEGQVLDAHSISKGKGFQGAVKRFGVTVRQHKAEKTKRGTGNLGSWTPKKVLYSVPQPGKMGYHKRTEYNKQVMKIGKKPEEINPKSGFVRYGVVKNQYMLIKGSIVGPNKRTIVLTEPARAKKVEPIQEISYISLESKQGR